MELGHFAVGDPAGLAQLPLGEAEMVGELAHDQGCGPVPQFARQGVPHDRPRIVVAIGVDGLAEQRIILGVAEGGQ